MVSAGMTLVRYLIFIFNFVFLISGIAIIVIGAIIQSEISKYDEVLGDANYTASAVFLIIVGCIVTVVAFFGCCGAIKENHCMIVTYAVFLGIIFILEFAAGITGFIYRGKLSDIAEEQFNLTWSKYDPSKNEKLSKFVDLSQHDFHCCGISGPDNWATYDWGKNNSGVPDSCCKEEVKDCGKDPYDKEKIYTDGCYGKLKEAIDDEIETVAVVGVVLAFIQLVGIAFACCLAAAIRRNYEVV